MIWEVEDARKQKYLEARYITQLEGLNIIWLSLDVSWEIGYEYARKYDQANGICRVQCPFVTDDGFKLGS